MAVVNFLARLHIALPGISRVIKSGVVRQPSNARRPRALDRVGQKISSFCFENVQRAHLRPARRSSIRQIFSVLRRLVPIERNRPIRRQLIRIHQHAIFSLHAFAHIKHRLVLHSVAPRIKIKSSRNLRHANAANAQQLRQPFSNRIAPRQRIEHSARVSHLLRNPLLGRRVISILQPSISIDNLRPMKIFLDRPRLRPRRLR